MGIPLLCTSKGIFHVETLVDSPLMEGITGKLLICSAEDLKIEVGFPSPLSQHDFNKLQKVVTPCWLTSTWEFVHRENQRGGELEGPIYMM